MKVSKRQLMRVIEQAIQGPGLSRGKDFAVGGSLNQVGRQFGATIGVAALITVVGSGVDISAYHNAWFVTAATGPLAALAVFFIREPNSNK